MPDENLEQDPQERPSLLPQDPPEPVGQPPADDADPDLAEVQVDASGKRTVPLSALVETRKANRELRTRAEQAERKAAEFDRVTPMLQHAQPFLEQLQRMTPEQQSAAIHAAMGGTAPSRTADPQPANDREAEQLAEDLGLVDLATGALDTKRARRILNTMEAKAEARVETRMAPVRQSQAEREAATMFDRALALTDPNTGEPLASEESLREAFGQVPATLSADPKVGMILALTAMGLDRMHGRTAKPRGRQQAPPQYADPIMTEPAGRRPAGPSQQDRDIMKRTGASESDFSKINQLGTGRSIKLE
jgi:hypothetical protein